MKNLEIQISHFGDFFPLCVVHIFYYVYLIG